MAITALLAFAAYSAFVVIVAVSSGKGHGSVFWTSIALIIVLSAGALWGARRLFLRRFTNRNAKPS